MGNVLQPTENFSSLRLSNVDVPDASEEHCCCYVMNQITSEYEKMSEALDTSYGEQIW